MSPAQGGAPTKLRVPARPKRGAPRVIQGTLDGTGLAIAIVASRYNEDLAGRLLDGAVAALREHGVAPADMTVVRVPGAFEIPTAALHVARSGRWDAIVCLGAVVRGETPHFEWVAGEAARGVSRVALETGVPVLFGVLTVDTLEQALDRAGGKLGNRGADAAEAAIEMARVTRALSTKGTR